MGGAQQGKANQFPDFETFKNLPDSQDPYTFSIVLPHMSGHLRMLKMGSVMLSDGGVELSDRAPHMQGLRHFNEFPTVEMNFVLEGNIVQRQGHLSRELHFCKGYHNVMYNQGEWESNEFIGAGRHNPFSIHIHIERFIQLFAVHSAPFEDLANKITKGIPFLVEQPGLSMTPVMYALIRSFWDCSLTGSLKSLFLETKTMELLLLQWDAFNRMPGMGKLSKKEIERMYWAREILLKDLQRPPTLAQLARLCGTNEFALKNGFKEVFGNTVFGYFNAVRLEQARQLLLHTEKTLAEIAIETGYAHVQHFSRAFRKQFGMAPGTMRR